MDNDVLLSVIVPAYNVEEWLPRCLDSIIAQTYSNLEVLVIDDGSTDRTPEIADNYAEDNKNIIVIHQANRGLVGSRERGIEEARGEFIGFVDGDDEIMPEMYERLMKNALKYNAQISQCGILYCFYDGRRKPIHGTGKLKVYNRLEGCMALLHGNNMEPSLCNKVYQASLLRDSCLDPKVINNEDMLRNIVLFNRAECSVMEDFCGYLYWRRTDSMSNNKKAVDIGRNILDARRKILEYVPEELKNIALMNYVTGAMNTYNALLGNKSNEACELREECRAIIKNSQEINPELSKSIRIQAFVILYFPSLYHMLRKAHVKRRNKRIRKQAAEVQKRLVTRENE